MGKSKIQWTDETWNPVVGCTKVSQGCKFCYAERLYPRVYPGHAFTTVRLMPERLEQPLGWRKPRMVFVNSMSDLFHENIPASFIVQCFEVMGAAPQHTYQILTKRTERIDPVLFGEEGGFYLGGGDFYPHILLGVSVEDQTTADDRIPKLLTSGWVGKKFVATSRHLARWTSRTSFQLVAVAEWIVVAWENQSWSRHIWTGSSPAERAVPKLDHHTRTGFARCAINARRRACRSSLSSGVSGSQTIKTPTISLEKEQFALHWLVMVTLASLDCGERPKESRWPPA